MVTCSNGLSNHRDFGQALQTWSEHPDFYHLYQPDEHVKPEPEGQRAWVNEIMKHRVTRFPSWNKGVHHE